MSYDSEWYSDPVTQQMLTTIRSLRISHITSLLNAAYESTDPEVQKHGSAIKTIDRIIYEIEEKSKPEKESDE